MLLHHLQHPWLLLRQIIISFLPFDFFSSPLALISFEQTPMCLIKLISFIISSYKQSHWIMMNFEYYKAFL